MAVIAGQEGRLDVLVNNAGISHSGTPVASFEEKLKATRPSVVSVAEVSAVFETNVFGVIRLEPGESHCGTWGARLTRGSDG